MLRRNTEIRARLERGDEDAIVNLWFYGTSFTKLPRLSVRNIVRLRAGADASAAERRIFEGRLQDLLAGIAAPVYSLSNVNGQEQVNFQVPFAVAGRSTAAVIVTRDGQASAPVDVPVSAIQPGVYTSDGTQAIVVHNADYSLATAARPLERDEYAFLYASGLGAVANPPADV